MNTTHIAFGLALIFMCIHSQALTVFKPQTGTTKTEIFNEEQAWNLLGPNLVLVNATEEIEEIVLDSKLIEVYRRDALEIVLD